MGEMLAAGSGVQRCLLTEQRHTHGIIPTPFSPCLFLPLPTAGWVLERLFLPLGHGQSRSHLERTQKAVAVARKGARDLLERWPVVRGRVPRVWFRSKTFLIRLNSPWPARGQRCQHVALSALQSGTGSFPLLRCWPGCQGTEAVGLHFSTSIADCSPPGWQGHRSPHQVSKGKSPLGSKQLGWRGAGHPRVLSPSLKFPSRARGCPCPSMGDMSYIPQSK